MIADKPNKKEFVLEGEPEKPARAPYIPYGPLKTARVIQNTLAQSNGTELMDAVVCLIQIMVDQGLLVPGPNWPDKDE